MPVYEVKTDSVNLPGCDLRMRERDRMNSSQSQFIPDETRPQDSRGCFVTTRRMIMFTILTFCLILGISCIMYYYGPRFGINEDPEDLEKLLNNSLNSDDDEDIRLRSFVRPHHYKLRLIPVLDEGHPDRFTYSGRITIILETLKKTSEIVLNSQGLNIPKSEVSLITIENVEIKSLYELAQFQKPEEYSGNLAKTVKSKRDVLNNTQFQIVPPQENATTSTVLPPTTLFVKNSNNTNGTYEGNVTATTTKQLISSTETVTISTPLEITTQKYLHGVKSNKIEIRSIIIDSRNSRYIIKVKNHLEPGVNYTLEMVFYGNITDDLKGFYRTFYEDSKGYTQLIVTTMFQPTFARRAFPCFDQPDFRATFEISIARPKTMITRSNMPLRETEPFHGQNKIVWDHYQKSPPMPPSSVAFVIFNYKNITLNENVGPSIRIWTPEHQLNSAKYALQSAARVLKYLEQHLNVTFPLAKVDFISMPSFIKENLQGWGLAQISESSLLLDADSYGDSWAARTNIFHAVAHGIAHQWFGNLVTMKWWSDIWLSEGLSNYMATISEEHLEPMWETLSNYPLKISQVSLTMDKLYSTRSLRKNFTSNFQIEQSFDSLLYQKGSCILRMVDNFLGETDFTKGIESYLDRWAYTSTTEEALWDSFAAGPNIVLPNVTLKTAMRTWTEQSGFPVVTVIRNYTNGDVSISQQKFVEQNETDGTLWYIPLTYTAANDAGTTKMWLVTSQISIQNFNGVKPTDWILFNIDQAGYYRVNYDKTNWMLLIKQLEKDPVRLSEANRAQLIDDAFELAENGHLNYEIPMKLLRYLPELEGNFVPWGAALSNLELLETVLHNTKHNGILQNYLVNLVEKIYVRLFPNHVIADKVNYDLNEKQLKLLILKTACHAHYEPCTEWALKEFYSWMNSNRSQSSIPYHYRQVVYCTAIKLGGKKEWEFLWNQTRSSTVSPGDLEIAYLSLGCTRDPWLISRYLGHTLDDSIPINYIPYVWKSLGKSVGLHVGFKFLRLNWNEIHSQFGDNYDILVAIVEDFLSNLSTKIDLEDLTTFFRYNQGTLKPVASLMMQTVDRIKLRIYWWDKHMINVTKFLNE